MKGEYLVEAGWGVQGPPPCAALHKELVIDRLTGRDAIGSIRHPAHTWRAPMRQSAELAAFESIAMAYLTDVAMAAELRPGDPHWLHPDLWQRLQHPQGDSGFRWLPCTWSGPRDASPLNKNEGPLGSIRVTRVGGADKPEPLSDTLVLLAGNVNTKHQLQFGADIGIRIVIHLAQGEARIYGVTLSNVSSDHALLTVPREVDTLLVPEGLRSVKQAIADALVGGPVDDGQGPIGCEGAVWLHNIERSRQRGAPTNRYSVSGLAARVKNPHRRLERSRIHDFRVEIDIAFGKAQVRGASVVHVHRNDYIGSAAGPADAKRWVERRVRAFAMDGASQGSPSDISRRRSTRTPDDLDKLRSDLPLYTRHDASQWSLDLQIDNPRRWFETRTAEPRTGPDAPPPTLATNVSAAVRLPDQEVVDAPVLSDKQGSIETHLRATELFSRLQAYGFEPEAYFRFARLPLVQRARPAMTWAPDGELPNAEVRPFIGGVTGPASLRDRVQLLVRYGSASPFHREKQEGVPGPGQGSAGQRRSVRRKAQYLSVACDQRWAWHEFGHVLAYAGTGELELPFAHGVGDGLAAIAADPASKLAVDAEAPARFITFPWIEVPGRSHGRLAQREGYCWCGARNLVRLNFDAPVERYQHGYFGEQLMSSSLFRLYRALGGDTRDPSRADDASDLQVRLEASDYCIYLVMYALSLLGADSIAPAQTPDQFVAALIDADLATGAWEVEAPWPFSASGEVRTLSRRGGLVHKVIRWAFERQGLYATSNPRSIVDGLGKPPEVDVYIADRRPLHGPDGEAGGYAPVPLRTGAADAPWLAAPEAVVLGGDGRVTITVCNRGRLPAADVSVRAWARDASDAPWVALQLETRMSSPPLQSGGSSDFTFSQHPAGTQDALWVLASADAPADPSNVGPHVAPPTDLAALRDLVAHDNNLALARLR